MKAIAMMFVIITAVLITGCISQSEGDATSLEFVNLQEAYDSGLELKCESQTHQGTEVYFADGNIRANIRVSTATESYNTYTIITNDNYYYSWSDKEIAGLPITQRGPPVEQLRQGFLKTTLTAMKCSEQAVSTSLFEPPQ